MEITGNLVTRIDIEIKQDTDVKRTFEVQSAGVAVDISGWKISGAVRRAVDQPILLEFTEDNGRIEFNTNGTDGAFNLLLEKEANTLELNDYIYDIRFVDDNEEEHIYLAGKFKVYYTVTK